MRGSLKDWRDWVRGLRRLGIWPKRIEVNPLEVILLEITKPPPPFIALTAEQGLIET